MIKEKDQSSETERNKYDFNRDIYDDSDGAHLMSFGIEFLAEEAKENERSPRVVLLCEGLLKRGVVYGHGRVMAFLQHVSDT